MQRLRHFLLFLPLLSAYCNYTIAADYSADFDFDTRAIYDDNFRLTENDEISISGAEATPRLSLSSTTETQKLNIGTRLRSVRYDNDDFDTDDQFAFTSYSYQFERSSLGFDADYAHDSTNTSETTSSGRIGNKAERHNRYALAPSWSYQLSENSAIGLNGNYSKDKYDRDIYTGYESWGSNVDWNYQLNERWSLMARASLTGFTTEDRTSFVPYYIPINIGGSLQLIPAGITEQTTATETHSRGVLLGSKYAWNEQQTFSLLIGSSRQDTEYSLEDPQNICNQYLSTFCARENQSGSLLTADINWLWKNERQQFELSLHKSTQPTSDGQAVDQTQLTGSWIYSLTELQKIRLDLQGVRNRELNDSNEQNPPSTLNRNYASGTIEYTYQFTEKWFLSGSYRHRSQEYTDSDNKANAQTFSLGIRYHPHPWHWAR